jgi:hypothetical protein
VVGDVDGILVGTIVGLTVGQAVGPRVGEIVGFRDGAKVTVTVGEVEGVKDGTEVLSTLGVTVGDIDGILLMRVAVALGLGVGTTMDGLDVGDVVGALVGLEGATVGPFEGELLPGDPVHTP